MHGLTIGYFPVSTFKSRLVEVTTTLMSMSARVQELYAGVGGVVVSVSLFVEVKVELAVWKVRSTMVEGSNSKKG